MDNRLIELALEALEARRAAIEKEIDEIRRQLETGGKEVADVSESEKGAEKPSRRTGGGRRPRTAAERKAQSERMKSYWKSKKREQEQAGGSTAQKPEKEEKEKKEG